MNNLQNGGKDPETLEYEMISDPISFSQYKFADGNGDIYVFGDSHFSVANACNPCRVEEEKNGKCIKFINLLDKIFTNTKRRVDFFLETPFVPKTSTVGHIFEQEARISALIGSIMAKYGECFVAHKSGNCSKKYPNVRMHYIDVRFGESYAMKFDLMYSMANLLNKDLSEMKNMAKIYNYNEEFIYEDPSYFTLYKKFAKPLREGNVLKLMQTLLKSRKDYENFIRLFWTSENFHGDIEDAIGDELANAIYNKNDQAIYTHNGKQIKAHKIKKQIDKIKNPNHRKFVVDFIEKLFDDFLNNFDFKELSKAPGFFDIPKQQEIINKMLESERHGKKMLPKYLAKAEDLIDDASFLFLDTGVYLVDAYAISRMMKFFTNTDMIISFTGDMHSNNYRTFFEKTMQLKKEFYIPSSIYYKYATDTKTEFDNRCIISPYKTKFTFPLTATKNNYSGGTREPENPRTREPENPRT